jgi:hypothetical protein
VFGLLTAKNLLSGLSFFVMAAIGFYFSIIFQDMAYWSGVHKGVPTTLVWYWIGATLSYGFSFISLFLIFRNSSAGKANSLHTYLKIISTVLVVLSLAWTTFVIIAGQSGL